MERFRQHSTEKKANKTDDRARKLLSEISSFPKMKLFEAIIQVPFKNKKKKKMKKKRK